MQRLHTVITGVLTALLLTSAGVGAVSTGQVGDALAGVAAPDGMATETPTNSTATDERSAATTDLPDLEAFLERFDVTDAEVERIVAKVRELRADGTSRARIFHAVGHGLHDAGVGVEEFRREGWRLRLRLFVTRFDLTADQRDAVVGAVERALASGSDRSEIRPLVAEQLRGYGVTDAELRAAWRDSRHEFLHLRVHALEHRQDRLRAIDERFHDDDDHPDGLPAWAHRLQHGHDLTDEEIHEIVDRAERLRQNGASREEIKRMVRRMLERFDARD